LTYRKWNEIALQYKTTLTEQDYRLLDKIEPKDRPVILKLPNHTSPLNNQARRYIEKRDLDVEEMVSLYNLQSTNFLGTYNFRIIIPIYFKNQLVSYTSRDYTGKAALRYFSCKAEDEIMNHKDLLYGYDLVPSDHVIACEGPFDKFKLGVNAVATFGTGFKTAQIGLLATFKKIMLLYDAEEDARRKCDILGNQLAGLGCEVDCIYLKEGDPGSLKRDEARQLVKEIMDK
jgi:DNA primase